MQNVLAIVLSYLFGSIPWALVIGKVFYKTDVRQFGSGNLGGSNAGRVLGKKAGFFVTVLDGLKGFITVLFCAYFTPEATILAGLACCIGHCFPIFAKFKGGKAVATTMGYFFGISFFVTHMVLQQFIFPLALFFIVLYITKIVSISSLIAIYANGIVSFFIQPNLTVSLSFLFLAFFVTYRHKENIQRLIKHEEKKITWM